MDKESILNKIDSVTKTIHVDAWSDDVIIRQLTALERATLHDETADLQESEKESDQVQVMARALTYFLCDESGARMFESEDWEKLAAKSTDALRQIFVEGMKLSAMGAKAKDEAKKK